VTARPIPWLRWPHILRRKAVNWWRRPLPERLWLVPAFLLLGLARAALLTVHFRRIAPWLGQAMKTAAVVPLASASEIARALHIGRAIATAAHYTPWESKCLVQAMVARALLGACGLPYALFLGVNKQADKGLAAHAWVCIGPAAVTGGQGFREFRVVGTFVSSRLSASARG
jgi:hypothetical protein